MALTVFTKNVKNLRFVFGFFPGANKFTPVLVDNDQLLCFPEPFKLPKGAIEL